jgi:hypothetical protein
VSGDWIQLLFSTLFGVSTLLGVLVLSTFGPPAVRRLARARPSVAWATDDRRSTFASIVLLDSLLAPAPADAPLPPREDVTRRRRSAALPPPLLGPRPRAVGA